MKVLNEILLLEPGGEIRIGDGAPGVNFTGIRIYKTLSSFRFEVYENDALQLSIDEHGAMKSASGDLLDRDLLSSSNIWRGVNTFLKKIVLGEDASLGSPEFDASMIGAGTRLFQDDKGKWQLWVDKIFARESMTVMELLFMQKRVFNGSIIIARSGTGKPSRMEEVPLP